MGQKFCFKCVYWLYVQPTATEVGEAFCTKATASRFSVTQCSQCRNFEPKEEYEDEIQCYTITV